MFVEYCCFTGYYETKLVMNLCQVDVQGKSSWTPIYN